MIIVLDLGKDPKKHWFCKRKLLTEGELAEERLYLTRGDFY